MGLDVRPQFVCPVPDNPSDFASGKVTPSRFNAPMRVTGVLDEANLPTHSASLINDLTPSVQSIVNGMDITAYERAVMAGYNGTEGEFYTQLANQMEAPFDIDAFPYAP